VVGRLHLKRRSTIVIMNRALATAAQVPHHADPAEDVLGRLLVRGTDYLLRGRAFRTCHPRKALASAAEDAA
jgi:hypothetical protein